MVRIDGDRLAYFSRDDGAIIVAYRLKLDVSASPKWIDLVGGDSKAGEITDDQRYLRRYLAIYTLEKDTLTLCTGVMDEERPNAFTVGAKGKWTVKVWKRIKP